MGNQDSGGEDDEHNQQGAAAPQSQLSPGQDVSHRGGGGQILLQPLSFRVGGVSMEILPRSLNGAGLVLVLSRAWKGTPELLAGTKPVANWG